MEEFVDHGHQPKGEHVDGEFLITGSQPTTFFVPTDHPFNDISLAISRFVKVGLWGLVLPSGNHGLDGMSFDPLSHPRITIALVASQLFRPEPLSLMAGQEHMAHQGLERFRFMLLTGRQVNSHYNPVLLYQQMHLGAETPSGVA